MIEAVVDAGAGAFGPVPLSAGDLAPPWGIGDGVADKRGEAMLRDGVPEDEGPAEVFCFSDVAGGLDEGGELRIGNGCDVDGEGREDDGADGAFAVGGKSMRVVGAHEEASAGELDHAVGGWGVGWSYGCGEGVAGAICGGRAAAFGFCFQCGPLVDFTLGRWCECGSFVLLRMTSFVVPG